MSFHSDISYECVIPSAILINENIELSAVKLYAFIKGLTKLHGYCFATNEYLANLMKAGPSSIKRWLGMLKKEGYIEIETEKNGVHWQRRIYISDKFKKCLRRLMGEPPPAHAWAPPSSPVSPITKEYSKEEYLKRERTPPTPKGEFLSYGEFVKLRKEEFESLRAFIGSVKQLNELIDEINDYLSSTGKKPYKDYAATIRNWWRRKTSKNIIPSNQAAADPNGEPENRTWWSSTRPILHAYLHDGVIYEGASYIGFTDGNGNIFKAEYNDRRFVEKVTAQLKKLKIFV